MAPPSIPSARTQTSGKGTQQTPSALADLVAELSSKSKLDEFRLFFDLKTGPWDKLRGQLNTHVQSVYSWADLRDNETQRRLCAMEFLDEYGIKYWGEEHREKNLIEDRLDGNDACRFPQDKKPMTSALVLLLEKSSKTRRASVAQDVSFPNVTGSHPDESNAAGPVAGNNAVETTLNVNHVNKRFSPTISSTEAMKGPLTPHEGTGGSLMAPRRAMTEALAPRPVMMGMTAEHPPAKPGRSSALVGLSLNDAPSTMDVIQRQRKLPGSNMMATYFLVTSSESPSPREPVCIPFEFYRDSDDFLDKMEEKFGDEASGQLYNEMPSLSRRYAVVRLNWSGVSFVIRRGKPDLQALDYRVLCAWKVKDDGELTMIEFEIGVTLKPEV